jgi:hypothetical protein
MVVVAVTFTKLPEGGYRLSVPIDKSFVQSNVLRIAVDHT